MNVLDPEYHRNWYKNNRNKKYAYNKNNKKKKQAWVNDIKSSRGCMFCGETHPACLDFHHREPEQKARAISTMARQGVSNERILEEMDKCDVLCANCHRKVHWVVD